MKTWYKAVCDEHKEFIAMFVTDVHITAHYEGPESLINNDAIRNWLSCHYGCKLRLIHDDLDCDYLHNNGYNNGYKRK